MENRDRTEFSSLEQVTSYWADVSVELMKMPSFEHIYTYETEIWSDCDNPEKIVNEIFDDIKMTNISPNVLVNNHDSDRLQEICKNEKPSSGFPDLLVEDSSLCFDAIEVKGESDAARFNQIKFARKSDLNVVLAHVKKKKSGSTKRFACKKCEIDFASQTKAESHFCPMRFHDEDDLRNVQSKFFDFWDLPPNSNSASRAINWSAAGYGPSEHRESKKSKFAAS
jgi:hypothetical protein